MQEQSPEKNKKRKVKPIPQISNAHCGPAVVQMLLDNLGIGVTQENITKAAGAEKTIKEHGTRIDQLALATKTLAPDAQFWYKRDAKFEDVLEILKEHEYPVGVEWQGLFEDSIEDEDEDEDDEGNYGHYSIISHVDEEKKQIIIVDPYKDFINRDRTISIKFFLDRWWDTNEVINPETGKPQYVEDNQLFFIITYDDEKFPIEMGMQKFD